ncbi:MAG: hypothetical protein IKF14_14515 [Atopobiaceae bacterium]|nr:hypothetical protein [Atopobiaceae bacterium]
MKRGILTILLAITLLTCTSCAIADAPQTEPESVGAQTLSIEALDADAGLDSSTLNLQFIDGVADLPYVSIEDWATLMNQAHQTTNPKYNISVTRDGDKMTLKRENGSSLTFNAATNTLVARNYARFLGAIVPGSVTDSTVTPYLKVAPGSYTRTGNDARFNLSSYGIDIVRQQSVFLVPLQTANDLFPVLPGTHLLYNGETLLAGNDDVALAQAASTAPAGSRSKKLGSYTYNELCLMLDSFYGPKQQHEIASFAKAFTGLSYHKILAGTNPQKADNALAKSIAYLLDDGCSTPLCPSYLCGSDYEFPVDATTASRSRASREQTRTAYLNARTASYPSGAPSYEEVGNTAFVTLDELSVPTKDLHTVSDADLATLGDSFSAVAYAHKRITREGSPIRNVVIDLSLCDQGTTGAVAYLTAWLLGESNIALTNTLTNGLQVLSYYADVNLDNKFDGSDTLDGLNVYCLVSPATFQCGNLLAQALRASHRVTLVGTCTGGGSFQTTTALTASGSAFAFANNMQLNYVENGSIFDVEHSVDAAIQVASPRSLYDRAALVALIER